MADATYKGLEIEAQWLVSEYLSTFASFGWLDAKYGRFETDLNPNDGLDVIEDASFLQPRNAPKYTYGIGGTFSYPIGPGLLEIYTKYNWVDKVETSLLNLDVGRLDAREDLSASIGYVYNNMEVTLFGRNLTDESLEFPLLIAPLFASGTIVPGRSWGLEFSIDL